jgi:hypothetical protein
MKKLLLLLIAAMTTCLAIPAAHAYDKDAWRGLDKTVQHLYARMDAVKAKRDRYGAGPLERDQIARLHEGIDDLSARVLNHAGDPEIARKKAENLTDLMTEVESEYAHHHHEDVIVHVYQN